MSFWIFFIQTLILSTVLGSPIETTIINPNGCVFPFMYQGEVQNDCVFETVNNTRTSWCSLTNNYDRDGERRECWGNEENKPIEDESVVHCVFPFKYKEDTYHNCSNILYESEHGQCGTSENMNIGRRFRNCTVFDGVNGAKKHENGCFFPFVYNGTIHNDCIFNGNTRKGSWCSLTNNYDRDGRKQPCWEDGGRLQRNDTILPCKFPFKFHWYWFNHCIGVHDPDIGEFGICSVTGNMNIDRKMRYCTQCDWPTDSRAQTINPNGCVFPFMYQGEVQNDCVFETVNNTRTSWCSLTNNYDRDRERSECWGNEENKPIEDDSEVPCVFPFIYKGETFHNCSNILYETEHGQCGTTENMNIGRRFKNCTVFDDPKTPGVPYPTGCVFPFLYERIVRNDCIFEDGDSEGWCSRTNNYDRDRNQTQCWKAADEVTERRSSQPCVFPFIYKNATYDKCHNLGDDIFTDHGYCGTTENMNIDRRFKSCSYQESTVTNPNTVYSQCVFPFFYNQELLEDCVFDESNNNGWCSGTNNYDRDQIKKPCWKNTGVEVAKDAADVLCSFPFRYQNKTYNQCIHMFGETPYGQCGTTININVYRKYKDCTFFDEPRGTKGPSGCIFPFLYQGEPQNTCVYTNDEPGWCSMTNNYDRDGEKKLCWEEDDQLTESSDLSPCIFPFTYKNKTYKKCADFLYYSDHGQCATESDDINVGRTYRNCSNFDPWYLNTKVDNFDVPCHFPFIFKNKVYTECTALFQETKYGQCATSSNFDICRTYRNCTSPIGCHFPFVYQNRTYNDCIFDSFNDGWCSSTSNFDRDGFKSTCFEGDIESTFVEGNEDTNADKCHFPYTYRNRTMNSCFNDGVPGEKFICATTSSLNRDRKFKFCNEEEITATLAIRTHNNRTCVFPFSTEGVLFYGCTTKFHGTLWCEAVGEDGDRIWGRCLETPNNDLIVRKKMETYTGDTCLFPFKFKEEWYHGCTSLDHPDKRVWCATRYEHDDDIIAPDEYTSFDLCAVKENNVISTYGGNAGGANCHFPFRDGNTVKMGCVYSGQYYKKYWCATTSDYTRDKLWGYCNGKNTDTELKRVKKKRRKDMDTGMGWHIFFGDCRYPYTYDGKEQYSCVYMHNPFKSYKWWCGHQNFATDSSAWGECIHDAVVEVDKPKNAPEICSFPYVYNGKLTADLMVEPNLEIKNHPKPAVCSVTANYDQDKMKKTYYES